MLTLIFCSGLILILLYLHFTRNFNHWKNKKVHFLKPVPFIGNVTKAITLQCQFGEMFSEFYNSTNEPILGLFLIDNPCLLVRDPKIIKRVLITDFWNFYDRSILNNKRDDPVGTHILFNLKNPDWKEVRGKVSTTFSSAKLKIMSNLIEATARDMVSYLDSFAKTRSVVEMKEVSVRFTVNVISSTVFGIDANSFQDKAAPMFVVATKMVDWNNFLVSFRLRCYFLAHIVVKTFRMKMLDPECVQFLENQFWAIMNERNSSGIQRNDLIDILLKLTNNNEHFLDRDIITAQAVAFFMAGFETSSSVLSFAFYELALNPEIQTKLRNEINKVSEKYGGINYEAIKDMQYLDMVVKETLRKYPVVPFLERKCANTYTIPETGTVIEKDTSLFISVLGLHCDPQYFPQPQVFDPERFSQENKDKIESCCYLPFGDGPRNCIGYRFGMITVKIGLSSLIKNFVFEVSEETSTQMNFNRNGLLLSAVNGVKLRINTVT